MNYRFATLDKEKRMSAVLKVVGIGGGGCNAIESMIKRGLTGVEYVAVNTDAQVLTSSSAQHKVQVGSTITRGLGAGADPNVGKKSMEEDREKIAEILAGSDMVFVTSGMGGGTGTGGAPVVASIAKSIGALVVGIVTKPFLWEGKMRMINAEKGIQELRQYVDSLIVIPNSRLLSIIEKNTNAFAAFDKPNEVLYEATRGIADIITIEGLINVDFADVRSVMNQGGEALMGCGLASGENRAIEAAQRAISSPLLEGVNIKGAKHVLLNITGSSNLTLNEIDEGNNIIFEAAGEEANVIFGCVRKEEMNDYVSYTVIVTGFDNGHQNGNKKTVAYEPVQKPTNIGGGYSLWDKDNVDQENLDVPTYFRVNRPNASLNSNDEQAEPPRSGFKFDSSRYNFGKAKSEQDLPQAEDDETSSFLRKIMD